MAFVGKSGLGFTSRGDLQPEKSETLEGCGSSGDTGPMGGGDREPYLAGLLPRARLMRAGLDFTRPGGDRGEGVSMTASFRSGDDLNCKYSGVWAIAGAAFMGLRFGV